MKVGLLGTGFAIAHAGIYAARPDVEEVVVFGRTPAKLKAFAEQFGFATTTDIDEIYEDRAIDLIDVCLPTPVHAEHVVRAVETGKDVLCELPLASTMADARRTVEAQQATGREVFVDMFSRFDPGVELLLGAVADGRYGVLKTLRWATRTARLWEGYDLGLDSIAIDIMHSNLDTIVAALGRPQRMTPGPQQCVTSRKRNCATVRPRAVVSVSAFMVGDVVDDRDGRGGAQGVGVGTGQGVGRRRGLAARGRRAAGDQSADGGAAVGGRCAAAVFAGAGGIDADPPGAGAAAAAGPLAGHQGAAGDRDPGR
jgi:hypothetical protein